MMKVLREEWDARRRLSRETWSSIGEHRGGYSWQLRRVSSSCDCGAVRRSRIGRRRIRQIRSPLQESPNPSPMPGKGAPLRS